MLKILRLHLEKFIQISDQDFDAIANYFSIKKVLKKENVLLEGAICKSCFYSKSFKYFFNKF